MRRGWKVLAVGCACALFSGASSATAILPLDTFPTAGGSPSTSLPIYASFEWQEIAIPFSLAAAGTVKSIDTGIFYGNSQSMSPLIVGIARGGLVGSAFPESVFSQTICSSEDTSDGINFCQQFRDVGGSARSLAPGELFSWTGELYLAAGDYWLYASLEGDALMGAGWYVNDEFMRDDLAFRSCALGFAQGQGCSWQNTTWASVADFGPQTSPGGALQPAGSYAAPIARIQFDPGVRVPEPETLALFGLGLAGLAFAGRRKLN